MSGESKSGDTSGIGRMPLDLALPGSTIQLDVDEIVFLHECLQDASAHILAILQHSFYDASEAIFDDSQDPKTRSLRPKGLYFG